MWHAKSLKWPRASGAKAAASSNRNPGLLLVWCLVFLRDGIVSAAVAKFVFVCVKLVAARYHAPIQL